MRRIPATTWIGWIGAVIVATALGVAWAFDTFELKADSQAQFQMINCKLDALAGFGDRSDCYRR